MGAGAFARVLTGWTGTAVIVANSTTVTVTPQTRESVASFVARMIAEATRSGVTLAVVSSSAGVLTLTGSTAFDLTLTGTVETYTAWTAGPYSGITSVVGSGSYSHAAIPAVGLRMADPLLATSRGTYTGDDGLGSAGHRVSATSTIVGLDTTMLLPALDGYEFDYWHDGRVFGRFIVTGVRRVPLSGTLRSTTTTRFEFDVSEVA